MGKQQLEISRPFRLGGFATGDYLCNCLTCGGGFVGDKRAMTCLPCSADRLNTARDEGAGTMGRGEEAREMLSWLNVNIIRLEGHQGLVERNLRNKYLRLRALLAAPVTAPVMELDAVATLVMRWRCDMDYGDWPEDKAAALVGYLNDPHHGDCTKHPMTCLRCEAEAAYRMADEIISLQRGEAPADGSQVEPSTTGAGRHIPSTPPFIQWNGGENPAPGKVVEVRYKLSTIVSGAAPSSQLCWEHAPENSPVRVYDIIAYRIIPTDDQGGEGT